MKKILMLSGPDKRKGYIEEVKEIINKNLSGKRSIICISSNPDKYEKNDKQVYGKDDSLGIIKMLGMCEVKIENTYLIDNRNIKEFDKNLFLKLISVKGLGCKMALPMLSGDNINFIYEAINEGNINYLKKFPKIGDKVARQIILDLKGKLASDNSNDKKDFTELSETLKSLGYKMSDIKRILPQINSELSLENQIKEALKLLLK